MLFSLPFYVVAYICYRRQYQQLYSVLGVVGAIAVFGVLISLPQRWHFFDFFDRHLRDMPWMAFVGLPVSLLALFGPFYAAGWVFRVCRRLAQRLTICGSQQVPAPRPPAAPL